MEDKLIEILSQYDYPVILQGSLAQGEEYPEHFFTYCPFACSPAPLGREKYSARCVPADIWGRGMLFTQTNRL